LIDFFIHHTGEGEPGGQALIAPAVGYPGSRIDFIFCWPGALIDKERVSPGDQVLLEPEDPTDPLHVGTVVYMYEGPQVSYGLLNSLCAFSAGQEY
jgi:hypothetical protein